MKNTKKGKNRLGTAILIVLLFVAVIIGVIAYNLNDVRATANEFFESIKDNKTEQAYQLTTQEFKKNTPYPSFGDFIKKTGLGVFQSVEWGSPTQVGNKAVIEGSLNFTGKKAVPMEVQMMKENSGWKIHNVTFKQEGKKSQIRPPEDKELHQLVQSTMSLFAQAIEKKDMNDFYAAIADRWKKEIKEEDITKTFQDFTKKKIDLSFIKKGLPAWSDAPIIDKNESLILKGSYANKKEPLVFELHYMYEDPTWKLSYISVQVK